MFSKTDQPDKVRVRWPLALKLTAWYASSAFLLILFATGFLYWALERNLDVEDDIFLRNKISDLKQLLESPKSSDLQFQQEVGTYWVGRKYGPIFARILDSEGNVRIETPGMKKALPIALFYKSTENSNLSLEVNGQSQKPFSILASEATGFDGRKYKIQVAMTREREDVLLARYRERLWIVLCAALILSTSAGYWIAHSGVQPVKEITGLAKQIRSSTLSERIEPARFPKEFLELSQTFNEMLDRLEESFSRVSRFSDDIAHELRTPLNNLRGEIEVALAKERTTDKYKAVLGSCYEEGVRLSRMIDSLLFLARTENPASDIEREPVDISKELASIVEFYEAPAAERGIVLKTGPTTNSILKLNRPLFRRAISNLIDNALHYTTMGGEIGLRVSQSGDRVRVEVTDTGLGIPKEHLPRVMERFYRADPSRSHATGNLGLGLSIVKGIAVLHGGTVSISSEVSKGTSVFLEFPIDTATSNLTNS